MPKLFCNNQLVSHCSYGRGWVVCSGPDQDEVPWDRDHEWRPITLIEFTDVSMDDGSYPRLWVLHEDLEPIADS